MVPYVDEVVAVTVMRVLLFVVLHVCMLRVCEGARFTAMLVWGMDKVWLCCVQDIWVIHVVQVLCLAQLTCYG